MDVEPVHGTTRGNDVMLSLAVPLYCSTEVYHEMDGEGLRCWQPKGKGAISGTGQYLNEVGAQRHGCSVVVGLACVSSAIISRALGDCV